MTTLRKAKPFLKWVGGKAQLLPHLRAALPPTFGRYFEPFVGGGALFFDLAPKRAVLSDSNAELINAYRVVRDQVEDLIGLLSLLDYDKRVYDHVRALDPSTMDRVARASRFCYLNRCCFNGLYRVNKSGGFNVPFGRYANPTICDADNLRACSRALAGVDLLTASFEDVADDAGRGDLVYFDPPYLAASASADFTSYTADGFGPERHRTLATVAQGLVELGVHVLLSNADTPAAREIFGAMRAREVFARRNVSATKRGRAGVGELLLRGEPWPVPEAAE